MTFQFNPMADSVLVSARISGPKGETVALLALDTGATHTVFDSSLMALLGYNPALTEDRELIYAAIGTTVAPRINLQRITALDREMTDLPVVCLPIPVGARVDGLLGLDFFRGMVLTLDFRRGEVGLA